MENRFMDEIKIDKCIGYIWMSDKESPEVFEGKSFERVLDETKNPFIIEAQLYDKDNRISYSIKYVDGEYIVNKTEIEKSVLTALSGDDEEYKLSDGSVVEKKTYLANRMGDNNLWLIFYRFWVAENDDQCLGMPAMKLNKNVFVGFKK